MPRTARSDTRKQSILLLYELLQLVIQTPSKYATHPIASCLHSQAALSKFESPPDSIEASSLNTLKRNSEEIPGGYGGFDRARQLAYAALSTLDTSTEHESGTKRSMELRIKKLSSSLASAHEDLLLLSRLLERSMRLGRQYANNGGISTALAERCRREQSEILDMLTLRQTQIGRLSLVGDKVER